MWVLLRRLMYRVNMCSVVVIVLWRMVGGEYNVR